MEITQVKIFPVHEDKLKAFVSVVFDHCFMVNDIKVIQGKDGLFLSMPSRRKKTGEFKDVAHPLNNEMRRLLEEEVLGEYRKLVDDPTPRRPDRADDFVADPSPPVPASPAETSFAPPESSAPAQPSPDFGTATGAASPRGVLDDLRPPAPQESPAATTSGAVSASGGAKSESADEASDEKTLEEVQEMHLSDSFWSVR